MMTNDIHLPECYLFEILLEENAIMDISRRVKKSYNITCKTAITNELFRETFPMAEDAVKKIDFNERIEDMVRAFNSSRKFSVANRDFIEFDIRVPTFVKCSKDFENVVTMKQAKTKTVPCFATTIPDINGNPTLIFGARGKDLV